MEPTITLEFTSDTRQHLKTLEHELKQIHSVQVFFVEPRDETAPVLISLGIGKKHEAEVAIRRIAHTLYDFLHSSANEETKKTLTLVTIEGDSVDIAPLSEEEIKTIIEQAYTGQ